MILKSFIIKEPRTLLIALVEGPIIKAALLILLSFLPFKINLKEVSRLQFSMPLLALKRTPLKKNV
jgi:hypothetical protein